MVGAWLAARWDKPVTLKKLVIRQAYDRITDFAVQRFDVAKNNWIDLLYVYADRRVSSYSRDGGATPWGYIPDAAEVDGRPLVEAKDDRVFGNYLLGDVHPVFTINLPDALTTTGIRLKVIRTKHPNPTISVYEFEAYGRPEKAESVTEKTSAVPSRGASHCPLLFSKSSLLPAEREPWNPDFFASRRERT